MFTVVIESTNQQKVLVKTSLKCNIFKSKRLFQANVEHTENTNVIFALKI